MVFTVEKAVSPLVWIPSRNFSNPLKHEIRAQWEKKASLEIGCDNPMEKLKTVTPEVKTPSII